MKSMMAWTAFMPAKKQDGFWKKNQAKSIFPKLTPLIPGFLPANGQPSFLENKKVQIFLTFTPAIRLLLAMICCDYPFPEKYYWAFTQLKNCRSNWHIYIPSSKAKM